MDDQGARDDAGGPSTTIRATPRWPRCAPPTRTGTSCTECSTEAFADGRLDREEYDERSAATLEARTLGELPPLMSDLVPDRPLLPARVPLTAASSSELQKLAEEKWLSDRREAFLGFVGSAHPHVGDLARDRLAATGTSPGRCRERRGAS